MISDLQLNFSPGTLRGSVKYYFKSEYSSMKEKRLARKQRKLGIEEVKFSHLYDNNQIENKWFFKQGLKMFFFPQKYYDYSIKTEAPLTEFPDIDYKGNVYILLNRNSASCSEWTTAMFKMFENEGLNVIIVGNNSMGAVRFINPTVYYLPQSHTRVILPAAKSLPDPFNSPDYKGESEGWYPDYWSTNDNLVNTLVQLTKDQKLEEVLKNLDKAYCSFVNKEKVYKYAENKEANAY